MKPPKGDKRSLIRLSLGSKIKRDQFLTSVNNFSTYKIKKTFPQRYREPQRKMEQVAYCLRQTFPRCVATDYRFEGVILDLIYKTRATALVNMTNGKPRKSSTLLKLNKNVEKQNGMFSSTTSLSSSNLLRN